MKRLLSGTALLLAFGLSMTAIAKASTVTSVGVAPFPIDTANGTPPSTVGLDAVSFAGGSSFAQGLTFTSGYDGAGGPLPVAFSEDFTDGTNTVTANFTGTFLVSSTTDPDTFTLDPTSFMLDGSTYTFAGTSFFDNPPFPGGVLNEDLNFAASSTSSVTPEPSSLALLGTGVLGVIGAARRRFAV